jgi:hypothetical protein
MLMLIDGGHRGQFEGGGPDGWPPGGGSTIGRAVEDDVIVREVMVPEL